MKTGVIFVLIRDGKILMQQRDENCKKFPLAWCLPGGARDYDESYEETLIREIKEEYDLDIDISNCKWIMNAENELDRVYVCKVSNNQEPKLLEGLSMKWMTITEIEKLELGFNQKNIISRLVEYF